MKPEKQLYQWDVNQYLTGINPAAQYVDYTIGNEVIRIEEDGTRCRIPDEVLQTYGGKTCYERYPDGTYRAYSFNVLYAPKPPEYVYTPEERTTFEALTARVDSAIDEIKRRADSGEFTPKKGVDYFTDAEKAEMMESVSDGAIGEFRKVVDTATTEYNANAAEKLTTYDTNAEQHTTDYNRNAAEKLEAYNINHTEKVAEYNQNAETKKAEFDANAAALQTEVDRLRGECDNLAAENRKQENRIDALMKLNKGQTYDILPEEGETASRTAPSGAKYVSVDKVGGKSVVWNQLWNYGKTKKDAGVTFTYENHFYDVVKNTTANNGLSVSYDVKSNNKYYVSYEASSNDNIKLSLSLGVSLTSELTESNKRYRDIITTKTLTEPRTFIYLYSESGVTCSYRVGNIKVIDLTQMFGAGNEPTIKEFEAMFPDDYYPYCEPTIISSQTDSIEVRGKNLCPICTFPSKVENGVNWHNNGDGTITATGVATDYTVYEILQPMTQIPNIIKGKIITISAGLAPTSNVVLSGFTLYDESNKVVASTLRGLMGGSVDMSLYPNAKYMSFGLKRNNNIKVDALITPMIEIGPTATPYKSYSLQTIPTNLPVLRSAGTAHDAIDMDGGTIQRNIGAVDLGTLTWDNNGTFEDGNVQFIARVPGRAYTTNGLCDKFEKSEDNALGTYTLKTTGDQITFTAPKGTEIHAFVESMSGATLYYELEKPTTEPVTIPEPLQEWLPAEPGGTVAFRNADESKQLAVPNAVSWVRKLDEVN